MFLIFSNVKQNIQLVGSRGPICKQGMWPFQAILFEHSLETFKFSFSGGGGKWHLGQFRVCDNFWHSLLVHGQCRLLHNGVSLSLSRRLTRCLICQPHLWVAQAKKQYDLFCCAPDQSLWIKPRNLWFVERQTGVVLFVVPLNWFFHLETSHPNNQQQDLSNKLCHVTMTTASSPGDPHRCTCHSSLILSVRCGVAWCSSR